MTEPRICDTCSQEIKGNWFDAKTKMQGQWGLLCPPCFKIYGIGLGTGKGQEFDKTGKKLRG